MAQFLITDEPQALINAVNSVKSTPAKPREVYVPVLNKLDEDVFKSNLKEALAMSNYITKTSYIEKTWDMIVWYILGNKEDTEFIDSLVDLFLLNLLVKKSGEHPEIFTVQSKAAINIIAYRYFSNNMQSADKVKAFIELYCNLYARDIAIMTNTGIPVELACMAIITFNSTDSQFDAISRLISVLLNKSSEERDAFIFMHIFEVVCAKCIKNLFMSFMLYPLETVSNMTGYYNIFYAVLACVEVLSDADIEAVLNEYYFAIFYNVRGERNPNISLIGCAEWLPTKYPRIFRALQKLQSKGIIVP